MRILLECLSSVLKYLKTQWKLYVAPSLTIGRFAFCPQCNYGFCMVFKMNSDHFSKQNEQFDPYFGEALCFLHDRS
jgi:hypothetical protein